MTTHLFFLRACALGGFFAVLLGAVGAHLLRGSLDEHGQAVYQTAVQYHFWHVLALGLVASLLERRPDSRWLKWSGGLLLTGVILFSGGLYLFAVSGETTYARIAPFGGAMLLLGWLALFAHVLRPPSR